MANGEAGAMDVSHCHHPRPGQKEAGKDWGYHEGLGAGPAGSQAGRAVMSMTSFGPSAAGGPEGSM